jgi:thymidylate synthase
VVAILMSEQAYLDLLQDIMDNGVDRDDRTGTGTRSVFGRQIRFDLSKGFPLLTTKKMELKSVLSEILWFIEGSTDERRLAEIRYGKPRSQLISKGTIWTANVQANYWKTKAKFDGDLGQIYGQNWRRWETIGLLGENELISRRRVSDVGEFHPRIDQLDPKFLITASNLEGKIFINNTQGASAAVIGAVGKKIIIRFEATGSVVAVRKTELVRGQFLDPYHLNHYGVCIGRKAKFFYRERAYEIWRGMVERCLNPNDSAYSQYGGKGVIVGSEWKCFENFLQDISQLPYFRSWLRGGYELDKDYYGSNGYSKDTCVFLSKKDNLSIVSAKPVFDKKTGKFFQSIGEAANICKVSRGTVHTHMLKNELGRPVRFSSANINDDQVVRKNILVDQLDDLVKTLRDDPSSRRHILQSWNPGVLNDVALPACHAFAQFYVANNRLSCFVYCRSQDAVLGTPYNISSYALLTHMLAHVCGLEVSELVFSGGDVHIYHNHMSGVPEQLSREPRRFPKLIMESSIKSIDDFRMEHFSLEGYDPHPPIKYVMAV